MKSLLFTPANEKMLSKIGKSGADAYIIDLEDSIKESGKEQALKTVDYWLSSNDYTSSEIFVRLNKPSYRLEIEMLKKFNIGFMLPKFEFNNEYIIDNDLRKEHKIIGLIETPLGILNLGMIKDYHWLFGIAFGAEDFSASINMINNNDLLVYPKQALVVAAKSIGVYAFDTPSFEIKDKELMRADIEYSTKLGFDGKLAIHPVQIEIINEFFSTVDIEYLRYIVRVFEESDSGAVVIDGKIYERMHIERMKRILRENGN